MSCGVVPLAEAKIPLFHLQCAALPLVDEAQPFAAELITPIAGLCGLARDTIEIASIVAALIGFVVAAAAVSCSLF